MVYGGAVGNTWYREEMLPYLDRRVDVSDVEARRFLSYTIDASLSSFLAYLVQFHLTSFSDITGISYFPWL